MRLLVEREIGYLGPPCVFLACRGDCRRDVTQVVMGPGQGGSSRLGIVPIGAPGDVPCTMFEVLRGH